MPYKTELRNGKYVNINTETGAVKGTFPGTPEGKRRALRQKRLLYGLKSGWEPTKNK